MQAPRRVCAALEKDSSQSAVESNKNFAGATRPFAQAPLRLLLPQNSVCGNTQPLGSCQVGPSMRPIDLGERLLADGFT
jgi:hypothetical protein